MSNSPSPTQQDALPKSQKPSPSASVKKLSVVDPDSFEYTDNTRRVVEINLYKDPQLGCGFNIVGGIDSPHIPGHTGFFISRLNPEGPAAKDGRLRCGDRILCVNDTVLSKMTHDEAVDVFKNVSGQVRLMIEQDAEAQLLSQPSRIIPPSTAGSLSSAKASGSKLSITPEQVPVVVSSGNLEQLTTTTTTKTSTVTLPNNTTNNSMLASVPLTGVEPHTPIRHDSRDSEPSFDAVNGIRRGERHQSFREPPTSATFTPTDSTIHTPASDSRRSSFSVSQNGTVLPGPHFEVEDDRASTISVAPSTHSIIDDVPRTPKRPISILDPASTSILTEALYVSVGVAALGVGIMAGYYFFKRRFG